MKSNNISKKIRWIVYYRKSSEGYIDTENIQKIEKEMLSRMIRRGIAVKK